MTGWSGDSAILGECLGQKKDASWINVKNQADGVILEAAEMC